MFTLPEISPMINRASSDMNFLVRYIAKNIRNNIYILSYF